MMRMLEAGGIPALTDGVRLPDANNPHGYFEYEPVKRLARDSSWMEAARGRAVKIIHRLLVHLPEGFEYRVIFMDRDLAEVFESQREMLAARGHEAASQNEKRVIPALAGEVRAVKEWLASRPGISALAVPYSEVVRDPAHWSGIIARFLGGGLNEAAMAGVVDPALHHQRGSK
jgi:hypothetical protein